MLKVFLFMFKSKCAKIYEPLKSFLKVCYFVSEAVSTVLCLSCSICWSCISNALIAVAEVFLSRKVEKVHMASVL